MMVISGTGCALADYLYKMIDFNGEGFSKYLSVECGDGGLKPGGLVFAEELTKFSGLPYSEVLADISNNRYPDTFNIGGPSLVSLVHASQLLSDEDFSVRFFGIRGSDMLGKRIIDKLKQLNLDVSGYLEHPSLKTPVTDVFSDPNYNDNQGERIFINQLGAASEYSPEFLDPDFYLSDIICFGGTALVPLLHAGLTEALRGGKQRNCITIVNTVYDYYNELKNPFMPWPLLESENDYSLIDILIMDKEESIRISGMKTLHGAAAFFSNTPVGSFIITNGGDDILFYSNGTLFEKTNLITFPVSHTINYELTELVYRDSDTTGCGDNFAGGIIVSVAEQLKQDRNRKLDMLEALSLGVASGGFACRYLGGVYTENRKFEKKEMIEEIKSNYLSQVRGCY